MESYILTYKRGKDSYKIKPGETVEADNVHAAAIKAKRMYGETPTDWDRVERIHLTSVTIPFTLWRFDFDTLELLEE